MWLEEKDNGLLIYKSDNFKYCKSVAIFSFYKTLVDQQLKLYDVAVSNVLNNINAQGSIIIIDNFKESIENIKKAVNGFSLLVDIPFLFIASIKKNKYRKPYTNIFEKLKHLYEEEICNDKSIVIGANAGRLATNKLYKDDSDIDRAFASNTKIQFFTPEQLFKNDNTSRAWKWRDYSIERILMLQKYTVEPDFNTFLEQDVVIMVSGPPCSGKSLLGNRIKHYFDNNISIIDINNFENRMVMKDYIENYTFDSKNVLIIDTMENEVIRQLYFSLFHSKKIIFIEIDTYRKVCEFLNKFKLQIAKSPKIEEYSSFVFNKYYNSYKPLLLKDNNNPIQKYIKYPLILRTREEIYWHY